jgi:hypothetical protein
MSIKSNIIVANVFRRPQPQSRYGEIFEKDARYQNALAMVQAVEREVSRVNEAEKSKQTN